MCAVVGFWWEGGIYYLNKKYTVKIKWLNNKDMLDLLIKCGFTFTSALPAMISPASEMGRKSGISW